MEMWPIGDQRMNFKASITTGMMEKTKNFSVYVITRRIKVAGFPASHHESSDELKQTEFPQFLAIIALLLT